MSKTLHLKIAALCLALYAMTNAWAAKAPELFKVEHADTHLSNGVYLLNYSFQLSLPDKPQEALNNGLSLYFQTNIRVWRQRKWWINEDIVAFPLNFRLRYDGLTERYLVERDGTGETNSFRSLKAALWDLGSLKDYTLVSAEQVGKSGRYKASVQISLDISQLPAPLRPQAYISNDWQISSELYRWNLK